MRAPPLRPAAPRGGRRRGGFTLLEMLVVVGFTATLLTFAAAFYVDLTRGSTAATELARRERHATALLDRVAHDLEHAVLVKKPDETDPLEHPWLFLAESRRSTRGADRLKLDVRAGRPPGEEQASDLSVVAWFARTGPGGELALYRWASPRLPERLDRSFPDPEDEGAHRVAEDLAGFGVRLLGEEGSWSDAWDSSTLARSGRLPLAAEITVALPRGPDAEPGAEPLERTRRVVLRTRPLDLQARLEAGASDEEGGREEGGEEESAGREEGEAMTVGECLAQNPQVLQSADVPQEVIDSVRDRPVDQVPQLRGLCP